MRALGTLRRLGARLRGTAHSFRKDEEGAVAIMAAAVLVGAVVIIGGAVDVYRYEMLRKRCQNALDRGVLAAAALNQSVDPKKMVRSYMKSAGCDLPANTKFNVTRKKGYRAIEAETTFDLPLTFLRLANLEQWDVPVFAKAEEREREVEISVVLDLSGSMASNVSGKSQRRIDALKPAAIGFVRQMLDTQKERDLTSISLVPYSGQVSLGREMFDHLAGPGYQRIQPYSSCFHLEDKDFSDGVPNFSKRKQLAHYSWGTHKDKHTYDKKHKRWDVKTSDKYNEKVDGVWVANNHPWRCPIDAFAFLNRDPAQYSLTDGTKPLGETIAKPAFATFTDSKNPSLENGRKVILWSQTLWDQVAKCEALKPVDRNNNGSFDDGDYQAATSCAEVKGATVPDVADRTPKQAYTDGDLEYVDDYGSITYLSNDPEYLAHRLERMPVYGSTGTDVALKYAYMLLDPDFQDEWSSFMTKGLASGPKRPAELKKRPKAWNEPNTFKYLVVMTDGRIKNQDKVKDGHAIKYGKAKDQQVYSESQAKNNFATLCENAKKNGVSVFSIGFDLGGASNTSTRKSMEDCASNRSQYFNVEDGDIGAAFDAIAASIQKLRLTS